MGVLAERGKHIPDVGEEGEVRAHDHDPAPGHLLLVRVQEVRHPVQADRGLAGAGRPLHAHGGRRAGPDDVVLLGLDRGDDVAHRAGAGPLDLVDEQVADGLQISFVRTVRGGCGRCIALESLVFVGGERTAGETEPPPEGEAHRLGLAGPVERH
jgi:hypothetical protein